MRAGWIDIIERVKINRAWGNILHTWKEKVLVTRTYYRWIYVSWMDRWAGSTHLHPNNNAVALLQPKGTRIVISSMALKTINIRWIITGSQ